MKTPRGRFSGVWRKSAIVKISCKKKSLALPRSMRSKMAEINAGGLTAAEIRALREQLDRESDLLTQIREELENLQAETECLMYEMNRLKERGQVF